MNTKLMENPIQTTLGLLANLAAWWGFVLTPIYVIGFGLMLPYARAHAPLGSELGLSVLPPLTGLLLAVPGLTLSSSRVPGVVGTVLNAIPLVVAVALRLVQGTV